MAKNKLLEDYKGRLSIAEKMFASKNNGKSMGNTRKMITAQCLSNVSTYLNEAFEYAAGTQRADLGAYKIFCLDITTLTMPNLIINDLFMVQPLASFQGYLTYMEYGLGERKGGVGGINPDDNFHSFGPSDFEFDTVTQNPFVWKPMTQNRAMYTSDAIVEPVVGLGSEGGDYRLAWGPVIQGAIMGDDKMNYDYKVIKADGSVEFGNFDDLENPVISGLADGDRVAYKYNNQMIPEEKIPSLRGHMKGIALQARARRIAVEYSQFAAFQS